MRTTALALLAAAAAAAACASTEPEPRGSWGGIVEEAPPPPVPLKGALSVPTPSVRPAPEREFTAEEQAFLDEAWGSFRRSDSRWPEMKERWQSMGPEAEGVLADNLYRAMVASRARSAPHLVEEAKKDLVLMGEAAVPILVAGLSVRAVRTADGQEIRVGQEVLHDAAEALSLIGPPSVPGLLDIARSGEPNLVKEAVWALGNIGDPRAEEDLLALAAGPDWSVRAPAALALRRYPTPAARARLVECLLDPETLVAERAAQALVAGRHAAAIPAVVDVLDRAAAEGIPFAARAALFVLENLTGERLGQDPAAWRARFGER